MNLANSGQAFSYIYMSGNNIHLIGMLRELNEITDIKYPGHSKAAIYIAFSVQHHFLRSRFYEKRV